MDERHKVYTLSEAAQHLRLTNRGVAKIARQHGLCMMHGRDLLFTDADIEGIKDVLRVPPQPRPFASHRAKPPPSDPQLAERLALLTGRPSNITDRRMRKVLNALAQQPAPKTHKQIEGCGARTIEALVRKGLVLVCGTDSEGDTLVRIGPSGRDELKRVENWHRKRDALMNRGGK